MGKYRAASDEILQLSREGKQQEASKLMTGEVYEEYKAFAEKLTTLCEKFQVELDQAKTMANVCTVIIFIVIVAAGCLLYTSGSPGYLKLRGNARGSPWQESRSLR